MFQVCQQMPAVKHSPSKTSGQKKASIQKTFPGPLVCQMYCAYCGNTNCNNGSICGHRQPVRGTYGFRKHDQHDFGTNGQTHEAEHAVGFAPANQYNQFSRKSRQGRNYENALPAYQEERIFHRQHIGTGGRITTDGSGFNSASYRYMQQELVNSGNYAAAVQINQLCYAFLPGFQNTAMETAADRSYHRMTQVPYFPAPNANGNGYHGVPRTENDRVEMEAARFAARTGRYPTESDLYRIRHEIGRRGQ